MSKRIARLKLLVVLIGGKAKADVFFELQATNETRLFMYPGLVKAEPTV